MKALAIDLGGSHATCAIVEDKSILQSEHVPLDSAKGLRFFLPALVECFRRLLGHARLVEGDCAGLACSFCNIIDARANRCLSTNKKFDDMPSIDFPAWGREQLHMPLRMENDARMALIGESYAGAARGFRDTVMVTLGTGIGVATMMDGRILRGKHAQAGILGGHIPIVLDGRSCTCGGMGCAEAESAGWALPLIARDWPGFGESALACEPEITFEALFRLAAHGDTVSIAIRDRCLHVWAANALGLVNAFDPELIVFGGGIMRSANAILPFIQNYIERNSWAGAGKVQVRAAELGNDAGLLGAVPLLEESL